METGVISQHCGIRFIEFS